MSLPVATLPVESPSARLIALLGPGRSRQVAAGAEFASPGQGYTTFYAIERGWCMRFRSLPDGRRQIHTLGLPGEFVFTEACIYKTSSQSVTALTEMQVSAFPAEKLCKLVETNAEAAAALMRCHAQENAAALEHLMSVGRRNAYERVIHLLLELCVRLTERGLARGPSFEMPLTQEVMADILGLSIIHVNRTLQRLRRDGLFEVLSGHSVKVTVLNPEAAIRLSGFDTDYLRLPAFPAR
jgi:CRP-like cAMP-binding protein